MKRKFIFAIFAAALVIFVSADAKAQNCEPQFRYLNPHAGWSGYSGWNPWWQGNYYGGWNQPLVIYQPIQYERNQPRYIPKAWRNTDWAQYVYPEIAAERRAEELQKETEELRERNAQLREENSALRKEVANLRSDVQKILALLEAREKKNVDDK